MIFEVNFSAAQTGVGYRFYSATGAYISARVTTGINAAPQPGVYLTTATRPAGAVGIYWDCDDPNFTASENFSPNNFVGTRRTVPFRKVLEAVVRRLGLSPDWDSAPHDRAAAICQHINTQINNAWTLWPWPETMALEERAFRPAWDAALTYAAGTELFYGIDSNYYTALVNTSAGQAPTDATAWAPLTITDKFIAQDAPGQTPIDQVYGVFPTNPRVASPWTRRWNAPSLGYRPSEKGIDILGGAGATVWISFRIRPPEFTTNTHVDRAYSAGEIVFWPGDGECYGALIDIPASINPSVETQWRKMPMLEILHRYVTAGAYADCLLESDPTDRSERPDLVGQARLAKAGAAQSEAKEYLYSQIDQLISQGERYPYYNGPFYRPGIRWPTTSFVNVAA
jgi:hypothetical protein